MIILGIDPSLTGTGIAILKDGKLIESKTLLNKLKDIPRIKFIVDEIINYCNIHKPDFIGIEGYAYGRANKATALGELSGVIKYILEEKGLTYTIIAPMAVKKFVTGKGNAHKELVLMKVLKVYGIEFDDNNKADAFVIAKYIESLQEKFKNNGVDL